MFQRGRIVVSCFERNPTLSGEIELLASLPWVMTWSHAHAFFTGHWRDRLLQ